MSPFNLLAQAHAAALRPLQSLDRTAPRLVLAADPAFVSGLVDQAEEPAIVELPLVRLAAIGWIGDLVMRGQRGVLADRGGDVAFHDLPVVDVELQAK